jgi:prepilin-type N-terminal cleavage/methylation domain-containing protein
LETTVRIASFERTDEKGMNMSTTRKHAFTLIELLVVISIISLLISILLPALSKARVAARLMACTSNLRQQSISMATYGNDFQGVLPIGWNKFNNTNSGWWAPLYAYSKITEYYKCPGAKELVDINVGTSSGLTVKTPMEYTTQCESNVGYYGNDVYQNITNGGDTYRYLNTKGVIRPSELMHIACFPARDRICVQGHTQSTHKDVLEAWTTTGYANRWPKHDTMLPFTHMDGHAKTLPIDDPQLYDNNSVLMWRQP